MSYSLSLFPVSPCLSLHFLVFLFVFRLSLSLCLILSLFQCLFLSLPLPSFRSNNLSSSLSHLLGSSYFYPCVSFLFRCLFLCFPLSLPRSIPCLFPNVSSCLFRCLLSGLTIFLLLCLFLYIFSVADTFKPCVSFLFRCLFLCFPLSLSRSLPCLFPSVSSCLFRCPLSGLTIGILLCFIPYIVSVAHTFTPVSLFCFIFSSSVSLCYPLSLSVNSVSPIFHSLSNTVSSQISPSYWDLPTVSPSVWSCLFPNLSLSFPVLGAVSLRVLLSPPCLYCPAGQIISILRKPEAVKPGEAGGGGRWYILDPTLWKYNETI